MSDQPEPPRNRRERRAAAKESGKPIASPTTAPKIKMEQPDRSKPRSKTLLDVYEEKKHLLQHGQPFNPKPEDGVTMDSTGSILSAGLRGETDDDDEQPIGPVGEAIFWTAIYGMLHFTLDVLVFSQYRQEIEWAEIFQRTGRMLPLLFALIYMMRSELASRFETARQVFFLVVSVAAGCYTIQLANVYDYYAVMKQAPPLGTLWIWSVVELRLAFAAASVVVDLGYVWWKGYSIY